ncbi:hypothetical protein DXG01_014336 [Tephrocybe rancida]|nr:hypothetical protein DXG01_014336 [Tephrocybe rancida]
MFPKVVIALSFLALYVRSRSAPSPRRRTRSSLGTSAPSAAAAPRSPPAPSLSTPTGAGPTAPRAPPTTATPAGPGTNPSAPTAPPALPTVPSTDGADYSGVYGVTTSGTPSPSSSSPRANSVGWNGSSIDSNSGTGNYGACCTETDIREANRSPFPTLPIPALSPASAAAPAPPAVPPTATAPSAIPMVATSTPTAKVTRPSTVPGSRSTHPRSPPSPLSSSPPTTPPTVTPPRSIVSTSRTAPSSRTPKGSLTAMGKAVKNGMVLVLSVWDDLAVNMFWLDSIYPTDASASTPGVGRGTCATTSGTPTDVETNAPNSSVTYSNIRFGEIGSTYTGGTTASTTSSTSGGSTSTSTTSAPASTATQVKYGQCGGIGYTGPTICAAGSTCTVNNEYYSQCL